MKTLSDFYTNYSSNPSLHKKVWRQGGLKFRDVKRYPKIYANPYSGLVPGLSYIKDVNAFFIKNSEDILLHLKNFKDDRYNILADKPTDFKTNYKWLCWFAWTSFMAELINYLEM